MNTAAAAYESLTLGQIHELEHAVWDHASLGNYSRGSHIAPQRHYGCDPTVSAYRTISHGCSRQRIDYS